MLNLYFTYETPRGDIKFEADADEALEYILRTHGGAKGVIKEFITSDDYNKLTVETKNWLRDEYGIDNSPESVDAAEAEGYNLTDITTELRDEILDDWGYYNELQDYFEADAYEQQAEADSQRRLQSDSRYW